MIELFRLSLIFGHDNPTVGPFAGILPPESIRSTSLKSERVLQLCNRDVELRVASHVEVDKDANGILRSRSKDAPTNQSRVVEADEPAFSSPVIPL